MIVLGLDADITPTQESALKFSRYLHTNQPTNQDNSIQKSPSGRSNTEKRHADMMQAAGILHSVNPAVFISDLTL